VAGAGDIVFVFDTQGSHWCIPVLVTLNIASDPSEIRIQGLADLCFPGRSLEGPWAAGGAFSIFAGAASGTGTFGGRSESDPSTGEEFNFDGTISF
jgi:hypothetical protein